MKVIIAGSRGADLAWDVDTAMRNSGFVPDVTEVVSGHARGADRLGEEWARVNAVPLRSFLPDWNKHGKQAGFIRNAAMAEYADALVAIWDGESRGTEHMIKVMRSMGKPVHVHRI